MTWNKLIKSKLFMFALLVTLGAFGYFFARELGSQYKIQGEITTLEQEIVEIEDKNQGLSDLIAYFKTESFQEKEVRGKLNLQKPGEHVVALPGGATAQNESVAGNFETDLADEQKNWRSWWGYFFGE